MREREQSVGEALAVFCADAEQLASEVVVHRAAGFDAIAQVEVVTAAMLWAQALMHLGLLRPCITRCTLLVLALALLVCCGVSLRTTPLADHGSDAGRFFFVADDSIAFASVAAHFNFAGERYANTDVNGGSVQVFDVEFDAARLGLWVVQQLALVRAPRRGRARTARQCGRRSPGW